jgi:F-type H+-transporting ATPase subunit gamma
MLTDYPGMFEKLRFDEVRRISDSIIHQYTAAEIDAVYLVYNEFKSVIAQRVVVEKLLPIKKIGEQDVAQADEKTPEQLAAAGEAAMTAGVSLKSPETAPIDEDAAKFGNADVDYIYEQSPAEIFNHLLPMYITTQIYHAMIESIAAEHAARMTAMDSASNNASDMIDSLTLTMNRVRQAAITKEIIEIVSGAEAL